jgi:predicted GNAT family N-acyltransferase
MVREVSFADFRDEICRIRRDAFGARLIHEEDKFDPRAHHFASFDERGGVLGVIRVLRSDEVDRLEIQTESGAGHLVFPSGGVVMECSRACKRKGASGLQLIPLAKAVRDYALNERAVCLVAKTVAPLLPLYRSMGFEIWGETFFSDHFASKSPNFPLILHLQAAEGGGREEDSMVW